MTKVDQLLADLPDNEARLFYTALVSPGVVPHLTLAETFQLHGHDISETAIRRWRQKHL